MNGSDAAAPVQGSRLDFMPNTHSDLLAASLDVQSLPAARPRRVPSTRGPATAVRARITVHASHAAATSALYTGKRVPKDDVVFAALGTSDELSSHIGLVSCVGVSYSYW